MFFYKIVCQHFFFNMLINFHWFFLNFVNFIEFFFINNNGIIVKEILFYQVMHVFKEAILTQCVSFHAEHKFVSVFCMNFLASFASVFIVFVSSFLFINNVFIFVSFLVFNVNLVLEKIINIFHVLYLGQYPLRQILLICC